MTRRRVSPQRAAVALSLALGLVLSTPQTARADLTPEQFESCLLGKINQSRAEAGLGSLAMSSWVNTQIRTWSAWMSQNEFRHMTSSERDPLLPPWAEVTGENIAWDSNYTLTDCQAVHDRFMASTGHRSNILNSTALHAAVGAYVDNSGWWITEVFYAGADQDDEMFFYRGDGIYRYYDINPDGSLSSPLDAGDGYTTGWDTITGIDLDGDSKDEMFFYREDGLYRFYSVNPDGSLPKPFLEGSNYTKGWDSISGIDLDGDGQDEMFFYRETTGEFGFYEVDSNGELGPAILEGDNYDTGWDVITSIDLGPG